MKLYAIPNKVLLLFICTFLQNIFFTSPSLQKQSQSILSVQPSSHETRLPNAHGDGSVSLVHGAPAKPCLS